MDTDMVDAAELPDLSSPPQTGVTNGRASSIQSPATLMSREPSLPAKLDNQLNIESSSSDDDDDDESSDASELRKEIARQPPLPYSTLPTGFCYDPRMRFHTELNPPSQRSDFHPEDPRRILAIYRTLCWSGLAVDAAFKPRAPLVRQPLYRIACRHATKAEILLVHDERHFDFLKATASRDHARLFQNFS